MSSAALRRRNRDALLLHIMKPVNGMKAKKNQTVYSSYICSIIERALNSNEEKISIDSYTSQTKTPARTPTQWKQVPISIQTFVNDNLAKHVTSKQIFKFLERNLLFKMEIDSKSCKDDNFLTKHLWLYVDYEKFRTILKFIFYILDKLESADKFIVQIPWETLYQVGWLEADHKAEHELNNRKDNPYKSHYLCNRIGFGSLVNMESFFVRYLHNPTDPKFFMAFNHIAKNRFDNQVEVLMFSDSSNITIRIVWKTELIKRVIIQNYDDSFGVFFELTGVPVFYFRRSNYNQFQSAVNGIYGKEYEWKRFGDLGILPGKVLWIKDIQASKTVYLNFIKDQPSSKNVLDLLVTLVDRLWYFNNVSIPIYATNIEIISDCLHPKFVPILLKSHPLSFDLYYACLSLFTNDLKALDLLMSERLFDQFFKFLCSAVAGSPTEKNIIEMINYFNNRINNSLLVEFSKEFNEFTEKLETFAYKTPLENCDMIRVAELYPSHIAYLPAQPILKSRISKLASPEHILRIKLQDNGGFDFAFGPQIDKDFCILANMKVLFDGIIIQNRKYQFLGSSSSQLKERSVTLYSVDENGHGSEQIRKLAGDFNKCTNVSKFISRFGLLFSQSLTLFSVDCSFEMIQDVEGSVKPMSRHSLIRERYCMSDGIGYISQVISDKFMQELEKVQKLDGYVPSAYQIRYGGFKGMLALNPLAPSDKMFFRPSMHKFDSEDKNVGLLKYSYPRSAALNRPLIMILDDAHKIEHLVFYKSFQENVHSIAQASTSDENALLFLKQLNQPIIRWEKVYNSQISILEEPFLKMILQHSMLYRLREDIKQKERLFLSPTIARSAFGIVDETYTLKPGQIFFQATRMDDEKTVVPNETFFLTGKVMIFRNPTMQPGDVRVFQAVNIPALHHLKDCIVFPLTGERSHADELSGGDYDGDEFVIVWNSKLIVNGNFKAMDFPYGQAIKSNQKNFSIEDMLKFFVEFFQKQNMGLQATLHLKSADYHPLGLHSKICEKLAYNYNIMLDSSKTGYFDIEQLKVMLSYDPDFTTSSPRKDQYLSSKILGQLFRQCVLLEEIIKIGNSSPRISKIKSNYIEEDSESKLIKNRLTLSDWHVYREPANEAFQSYKIKITTILGQTKVHDEAVLYSDCFPNKDDYLKFEIRNLKVHFNELFNEQVKFLKLDAIGEHLLTSAWYSICYEQMFTVNGKPLIGLPWLILEKVCALAEFVGKQEKIELKVSFKDGALHHETINNALLPSFIATNSTSQNAKNGWSGWSKIEPLFFGHWQVKPDQVSLSFWRPTIIEDFLKHDPAAIKNLRSLINYMTVEIVQKLILHVFEQIETIYNRTKIVTYSSTAFPPGKIIYLISPLIRKLMNEHLRKHSSDWCPTVSTLLNLFWHYLYALACNVNSYLDETSDRSTDIFFLKFAVFSMFFMNKIDSKYDNESAEKITENLLIQRLSNLSISNTGKINQFQFLSEELSSVSRIYQKVLDHYFSLLSKNPVGFNVLPQTFMLPPGRKILSSISPFLKMVTGCREIRFDASEIPDPGPSSPSFWGSSKPRPMYKVKASGYLVSLALLRLLLGHPKAHLIPFSNTPVLEI